MLNCLKEFREKKHITQAELARAVGVSRQGINAIEINQQAPGLKVAMRIAKVLGASVEEVFFDEDSAEEIVPHQTEILSKQQRLSLANQYKIMKDLALLRKEEYESRHYEYVEQIFENGYVKLYPRALSHIDNEMAEADSEEVLSILDMHRALLWSLGPKASPEELEKVRFLGFDGNNESEYLAFAEFFQNSPPTKKFAELQIFNSHHATLPRYRKMLAEWDRLKRRPRLSPQQIDQILQAGETW